MRRLIEQAGRWRSGQTWLTDGRARRAPSSRCRREVTAGVARGLRSYRIPSHRRTVRARWEGESATRASDDSAARAAPIPPLRTPPPRGQNRHEGHDSHATRDHGTARLCQKEGSRGWRRRQGPDRGTAVDSAQCASLVSGARMLVPSEKQVSPAAILLRQKGAVTRQRRFSSVPAARSMSALGHAHRCEARATCCG